MIKASEVVAGDVYVDNSGTNWIVRGVKPSPDGPVLRLAAGRTDPGSWEPFRANELVRVHRSVRS